MNNRPCQLFESSDMSKDGLGQSQGHGSECFGSIHPSARYRLACCSNVSAAEIKI